MTIPDRLANIFRLDSFGTSYDNANEKQYFESPFVLAGLEFKSDLTIFVPSIYRHKFIGIVPFDQHSIIYKLETNNRSYAINTPYSVLCFTMRYKGCIGCIQIKETCYYGGQGIMLTKDLNPLFIMGVEYKWDIAAKAYFPTIPIVYIDSSVFDKKDIMSKYIANNFIDFFRNNRVYTNNMQPNYAEIRINNLKHIVRKIVSPSVKEDNIDIALSNILESCNFYDNREILQKVGKGFGHTIDDGSAEDLEEGLSYLSQNEEYLQDL